MSKPTLITCVSIMPGNGAKYTATIMAHELAKKYPKKKVALVDLDLTNPYLYAAQTINDSVHGVDNLLDKISAEVMNEGLFMANMIHINGSFDLLKGTRKIGRESMVTRLHVSKIIEFLKSGYDYIVMVVPSDTDNAATTYGLFYSDKIVTIVRPNFPNLYRIEDKLKAYRVLRSSESIPLYLLYNMRGENDDIEAFVKPISDFGLQPLGYMVYDPNTIDNRNLGGSVLQQAGAKLTGRLKKRGGGNEERIKKALEMILGVDEEDESVL